MGILDKTLSKTKDFFSGKEQKSERRKSIIDERRKSIIDVAPSTSLWSNIDPILCNRSTMDPEKARRTTQPTPKVIRRGSKKMKRSMKNSCGSSIAFMSPVSSVSYAGPVINYQYEFKLRYGTIPNPDMD